MASSAVNKRNLLMFVWCFGAALNSNLPAVDGISQNSFINSWQLVAEIILTFILITVLDSG